MTRARPVQTGRPAGSRERRWTRYSNRTFYLFVGYGSAMLWVFFLIILIVTLDVQRSSRLWVYYEVDRASED